jgi:DNA-binding protein H-NS
MSTYAEIQAQIQRLQKEAEEVRLKELNDVISEIKAKIAHYNLSASDLGLKGARRGRRAAASSAAKYRGPNGETWSGFGRQPQWLKDAVAAGKSKEQFAI